MIGSNPDASGRLGRLTLAALLAGGLLVAALRGGSYAPVQRGELFALVLWVLVVAIALGLLPRYRPPPGAAVAVVALALLGAWAAIGVLWTESDERTVIEVARTLGFAGLLLVVVWTFGGGWDWQAAAAFVTGAALVVCALAFISRLAPDLLPSALASSGLYRRLAYPLNYWNALGSWAAMTVALTLAASAHARPGWIRGTAVGGACVATSVAYLTYSRATVIAVVLATVTVVVLSRHRWQATFNAALMGVGSAAIIVAIRANHDIAVGRGTQGAATVAAVALLVITACVLAGRAGLTDGLAAFRLPTRVARVALLTAALAGLVAAVAAGPSLADRAWTSFATRPETRAISDPAERLGSLSGIRRPLWGAALDAFETDPLRGTGAGTFELVWNRDPRRDSPVRDAHSLYLEQLGELGLPGALLLLIALGGLVVTAVRAPFRQADSAAAGAAAGCAGALVVFCVSAGFHWIWELTAAATLGLVCGGLAAAAGSRPAGRLRLPTRIGATLVACLCLAVQLPVLVAAGEVRVSREAIVDGRVDDAVSHATTAIDAQPWGASGYLQRAVVLERAGVLPAAAMDARRATDREPTNWETWLTLARIEAERGRVAVALRAATRARALNPNSPLFRWKNP